LLSGFIIIVVVIIIRTLALVVCGLVCAAIRVCSADRKQGCLLAMYKGLLWKTEIS
jgi:hypothetical protein